MSNNPKLIWLAPSCSGEFCYSDRPWCEDRIAELTCDDCKNKPTAYVRAGKKTAVLAEELATARAEIEALRAQVARLTNFTEADVERVADIIDRRVTTHWAQRSAGGFAVMFAPTDDADPAVVETFANFPEAARRAERLRLLYRARAALAAYVSREAE